MKSNNKIKITYIVYEINKALEFEWVAEKINKSQFELSFINITSLKETALNNKCNGLKLKNCKIYYKSKKNLFSAVIKTCYHLLKYKPQIVHCQLFEATFIGLIACKILGIKNRIYTRHHSTFHHDFAPNAVKYDIFLNNNFKKIIAVSNVVKNFLTEKENVISNKIRVIEHGIDFNTYKQSTLEEIKNMKKKHKIPNEKIIIGVISRYEYYKGISYIIDGFKKYNEVYPNSVLVLANAKKGGYAKEINDELINKIPNKYIEIDFEENINTLYDCFNYFVHSPIDRDCEAFGQIYIEAMYKKIPIIATKSGVGNSLLSHLENGYVIDYKNAEDIANGLMYFTNNNSEEIIQKAHQDIISQYSIDRKINELENLYISLA